MCAWFCVQSAFGGLASCLAALVSLCGDRVAFGVGETEGVGGDVVGRGLWHGLWRPAP
jgi:hypothetical protein